VYVQVCDTVCAACGFYYRYASSLRIAFQSRAHNSRIEDAALVYKPHARRRGISGIDAAQVLSQCRGIEDDTQVFKVT
jgi:hypothetical protein